MPSRPFSAGYGKLFSAPISDQELVARGVVPAAPRSSRDSIQPSSTRRTFQAAVHASGTFSTALPDVAFTIPSCTRESAGKEEPNPGEYLQRRYDEFRPYISDKQRRRIRRQAEQQQACVRNEGASSSSQPQWRGPTKPTAPDSHNVFILEKGDERAAFHRGSREAESAVQKDQLRRALVQEHLFQQFVGQVRHSLVGEKETGSKFVQEKLEAVRQARRSPQREGGCGAPHSHRCQECGHRVVYL